MAEDQPFYVGINNAVSVRRELLLSSKDLLTALKRNEVLKEIRKAKIESAFELRNVMEELMVLNRKLRACLPKTPIKPELVKPKAKESQKEVVYPLQKAIEKMPSAPKKDQLQLLQDAMSRVESQLRDLES